MKCQQCGGYSLDTDPKLGHVVCLDCGTVLEENTIVSEQTFTDTGKGQTADGFTVQLGQARAKARGGQNANRRISDIASLGPIRMPERLVVQAQRLFKLAVEHEFTRGRRSVNVACACLYIVCRINKTAHLLMDFSDAVSVNVFVLGQTFLALLPLVVSKDDPIPLVDPSLYIARFAQKLDFESSTLAVVRDANRIVQRMNRDWMVTGRRPAGLCAAALFVAARMHGFQRTVRELVLVVKICQGTIRTRLKEFVQTPSAQLTVKDFQTIWLEDGENPPAFQQSSHRESAEVAQKVKDIHQDDINQIENNGTQENICDDLDTLLQDISPLATPSTTRPSSPAHPSTAEDSLLHVPDAHLILNSKLPLSSPEDVLLEESITSTLVANTHTFPQSFHDSQASGGHDEPLGDMDDDDEVHAMVSVDADERAFKEGIWTTSNSDWILKQEQKALIGDIKPARVKRQKKEHGQSGVAVGFGQSASPAQAAREMIKMKPALSKKINYQALDSLFESKPVV